MDGTEGQNARWTRSEGGERQARAKMMSPRDWIRTNPKPETGAGRARVASRGGVGRARVGGRARGRSDAMGGRRRGGRERGMVARGGTPARRPGRHPGGVPALGDKRLVAMGNIARCAGDARRDGGNVVGRGTHREDGEPRTPRRHPHLRKPWAPPRRPPQPRRGRRGAARGGCGRGTPCRRRTCRQCAP